MDFIQKVVIKDGINADTTITINKYSNEIAAINNLLETIPSNRGKANYSVVGSKFTINFSGIGANYLVAHVNGMAIEAGGINTVSIPQNLSGVKPVIAAFTSNNVFFKLNYKLDEYHQESNGNFISFNIDGFSGTPNLFPYKMFGIFIQEDGSWTMTHLVTQKNEVSLTLTLSIIVDASADVYLKVSSNQNRHYATCTAYLQTSENTNKMKDGVISGFGSPPLNIVSETPIPSYFL